MSELTLPPLTCPNCKNEDIEYITLYCMDYDWSKWYGESREDGVAYFSYGKSVHVESAPDVNYEFVCLVCKHEWSAPQSTYLIEFI